MLRNQCNHEVIQQIKEISHKCFFLNYKFIANIEIDLLYRNCKGKC